MRVTYILVMKPGIFPRRVPVVYAEYSKQQIQNFLVAFRFKVLSKNYSYIYDYVGFEKNNKSRIYMHLNGRSHKSYYILVMNKWTQGFAESKRRKQNFIRFSHFWNCRCCLPADPKYKLDTTMRIHLTNSLKFNNYFVRIYLLFSKK